VRRFLVAAIALELEIGLPGDIGFDQNANPVRHSESVYIQAMMGY
jgi:hypothetical protein